MLGLALALLFIGLNGVFVAAEFALVKLRATRRARHTRRRGWREQMVDRAVERLDRYLGITQLGITLASLGLGWIGEPALAHLCESAAVRLLGHELAPTGRGIAFGIAFALLTLAHVLFGELVPKLAAIQRSNEAALHTIPLLRFVEPLLAPGLWVLQISSRAVLKLVGLPFDAYGEAAMSEDEILGILAANVTQTPRGEHKHELLRRVMRFADRTAKTSMIPRVDVASLSIETPVREAIEFVRQQQYSRVLLVRGSSLDDVAGYLYVKDLAFAPELQALPNLESLRRNVLFVAETQGSMDVLRRMQRAHTPFAVVVDEYGGTSGIITMEDLLEEIVGEISDETDVESARIERNADDGWDVDASITLDELATLGREVGLELEMTGVLAPGSRGQDRDSVPSDAVEGRRGQEVDLDTASSPASVDPQESTQTLGALVLARLQRLPRLGDRADLGLVSAEVLSISRRRVTRVRVRVRGASRSTRPDALSELAATSATQASPQGAQAEDPQVEPAETAGTVGRASPPDVGALEALPAEPGGAPSPPHHEDE